LIVELPLWGTPPLLLRIFFPEHFFSPFYFYPPFLVTLVLSSEMPNLFYSHVARLPLFGTPPLPPFELLPRKIYSPLCRVASAFGSPLIVTCQLLPDYFVTRTKSLLLIQWEGNCQPKPAFFKLLPFVFCPAVPSPLADSDVFFEAPLSFLPLSFS